MAEVRAHALLSASSGYRWSVCTPSARLEDQFADSSSKAAREGTLAHALAEHCLKSGLPADFVDFKEINGFEQEAAALELDEDDLNSMRRHVQDYVDYVLAIPGERFI
jgi:hypothetical protein